MVAGGAARYSELVRGGVDQAQLRALVAHGRVRRVAHGTYAVEGAAPEIVAAALHGGHVDCLSAVRLQGVATLRPPDRTHVLVPRDRGTRNGRDHGARLHRSAVRPGVAQVAGRVQAVDRALARLVVCRPVDESVVALDSALAQGKATLDDVAAHVPRTAPARVWEVLALGDAGSQSPIETLARLALRGAGFRLRTQVAFDGVGRVDLLVEEVVVVECDGFAYHSGRAEYRDDRRRDRVLHAGGLVVLRFTFEEVVRDPGCVVRAVRAVLAERVRSGAAAPRLRPAS